MNKLKLRSEISIGRNLSKFHFFFAQIVIFVCFHISFIYNEKLSNMKNSFNYKFILLTLVIGIVGFLLRPIFLTFSWDTVYLNFLSGVFAVLLIYYLSVSISTKQHRWHNAIFLVIAIIIVYGIFSYKEWDRNFYLRIAGMLVSLAFISLTFIEKVENWFLDQ